jgi:hypothetical protein
LSDIASFSELAARHDMGEMPNLGSLANNASFIYVGGFVGEIFLIHIVYCLRL